MPRLHRAFALIGLLLLIQSAAAEKLRLVADVWPPFTDATLVNGGWPPTSSAPPLAGRYASDFEQVPGRGRCWAWARAATTCWSTPGTTTNAPVGQFSGEYLLNRIRFLKRKDAPIEYNICSNCTPIRLRWCAVMPIRRRSMPTRVAESPGAQLCHGRAHAGGGSGQADPGGRVRRALLPGRESPKVRNAVEFLPKPLSENSLHILVSLKNPEHEQIVAGFDRRLRR
jgi:polar amino acid transport system substrate-binding protein